MSNHIDQFLMAMRDQVKSFLTGAASLEEFHLERIKAANLLTPRERVELNEFLGQLRAVLELAQPMFVALDIVFGVAGEVIRTIPSIRETVDFDNWDLDDIRKAHQADALKEMMSAAPDRQDLYPFFKLIAAIVGWNLRAALISGSTIPDTASPAAFAIVLDGVRRLAEWPLCSNLQEHIPELKQLLEQWRSQGKPETYWATLQDFIEKLETTILANPDPKDVCAALTDSTAGSYEIALSFAGEDREYVQQVADMLRFRGVRLFYDAYQEVDLWGKNLVEHLTNVYRSSQFCVMFISKHYANKMWPTHERRSAFEKALESKTEYILPARFDDVEIPGLYKTIAYIDLRKKTPEEFALLILQKLDRFR